MKDCWNTDSVSERMLSAHQRQPDVTQTQHGKVLQKLIRHVKGANLHVLDIGCGTGHISQLVGNHTYLGIDLPHIIENVAKKAYPDNDYMSVDIFKALNLEFIGLYDIVVMNAFIDVMEEPRMALRRILAYCDHNVILHRQEVSFTKKTQSTKENSYGGWTYHSILNAVDLKMVIDESGFKIVTEESCGFDNWEGGGKSILMEKQ